MFQSAVENGGISSEISLPHDPYPCVMTHNQKPLTSRSEAEEPCKWIVAAFRDEEFDLAVMGDDGGDQTDEQQVVTGRPYAEFWDCLRNLKLSRGTWKVIGWRVRYAIEKAGLLEALERGDVKLLPSRAVKTVKSCGGKVTINNTCVEVDLLAGKNKVKIMDFRQLGINPETTNIVVGKCSLTDARRTMIAYLGFCSHVGMTTAKITAAQMGWSRFRTHHQPPILSIQTDDAMRAVERRAQYGGRNEPFVLGDAKGMVYSLDVKSCYASVCLAERLPVHCEAMYPNGIPVDRIDPEGDAHWIADVVIKTDVADYPVEHGDAPIYPVGTFFTSLAWPELQHALRRGRVKKVTYAQRYLARPAMSGFARWFLDWRGKLKGTKFEPMLPTLKAAFVATIGFTARSKYEWQQWSAQLGRKWWIGVTRPPDNSSRCTSARVLDGHAEWLKIGGEPYEALPMLGVTVCSHARVKLLSIFDIAGRENILYCDTDGILCNRTGWDRLHAKDGMVGSLPGQLAERFPAGLCRIGGQKNYRLGAYYVCAGGINTRQSLSAGVTQLITPTGRTDVHGNVSPFEMACDDIGGEMPTYRNRMAGQEV